MQPNMQPHAGGARNPSGHIPPIPCAPRGILYHRYRLDDRGTILDAKIVPPTSQNQRSIEHDLRQFAAANIAMQKDRLQWRCEQVVRNYDPCISCATHFLDLQIES
jgi:sulfhydrogenase subunit alpha